MSPSLFVSWDQVAKERCLPTWHKDSDSCPYEELQAALAQPGCLFSGEKDLFLTANDDLLQQIKGQVMPLEHSASDAFQAMYQQQQAEFSWNTLLWTVARRNEFWIGRLAVARGGALEGAVPPHFHCL